MTTLISSPSARKNTARITVGARPVPKPGDVFTFTVGTASHKARVETIRKLTPQEIQNQAELDPAGLLPTHELAFILLD